MSAGKIDSAAILAALADGGSIAAAARILDCDRRRLSERIHADEALTAALPKRSRKADSPGEPAGVKVSGDVAVLVTDAKPTLGAVGDLIRAAGLKPAEWVVVGTDLSTWQGWYKDGDGEPQKVDLHQRKVKLARLSTVQLVSPARHVPALVRPKRAKRSPDKPELIVVEGDHQAPYFDAGLDACATAFVAELQPAEHVFLGDTADFPTISRHPDHPAAMATAQECIDSAYHMLRRRAEAAPNAKRWKLKGNHDWRLEGEVLARSERLAGLHPAGEVEPALSLRRLLQLDALGVKFVEDVRGWQHAEVVLVPGPKGLVVRHGFVTGHNTAGRTMAKLGRSVIVGHDHSKAHAWKLDYSAETLRQAVVAGTMSQIARDGEVFPHFTVAPDWHQGFVTVERWPSGAFVIEHAVYHEGALFWRNRKWEAPR